MLRFIIICVVVLGLSCRVWAADNITVLDGNRDERVIATEDVSGVHFYKHVTANPDGTVITWNDLTGLGVVPHEHPGHGTVHVRIENITSDQRVILIDLSDTTNWPHTAGTVVHLEYIDFEIDSDVNGAYTVHIEYLESCSTASCTSTPVWSTSGSKTAGNNTDVSLNWTSNGPVCKSGPGGSMSSESITGNTNYQTDTAMISADDLVTPTVYPNNGDVALHVDWIAGSFTLDMVVSYHSHSADHP